MTDEEAMELGRLAVACEAFRWMPGMLDMDGDILVMVGVYDGLGVCGMWAAVSSMGFGDEEDADVCFESFGPDVQPDLRDPATIGCVLHFLREGWGRDYHIVADWSLDFYDGDIPEVTITTVSQPSQDIFTGTIIKALEMLNDERRAKAVSEGESEN